VWSLHVVSLQRCVAPTAALMQQDQLALTQPNLIRPSVNVVEDGSGTTMATMAQLITPQTRGNGCRTSICIPPSIHLHMTRCIQQIARNAGCLLVVTAASLSAQPVIRPLIATAVVPAVARVVSISALRSGDRTPTGDLYVSGTVVSTNNGPFALQARIGSVIADTVMGRTPSGALQMLTVPGWVTVAIGPGGPNRTSSVTFLVKWAKSSRKRPADAEAMPIVYRVLPQN